MSGLLHFYFIKNRKSKMKKVNLYILMTYSKIHITLKVSDHNINTYTITKIETKQLHYNKANK